MKCGKFFTLSWQHTLSGTCAPTYIIVTNFYVKRAAAVRIAPSYTLSTEGPEFSTICFRPPTSNIMMLRARRRVQWETAFPEEDAPNCSAINNGTKRTGLHAIGDTSCL